MKTSERWARPPSEHLVRLAVVVGALLLLPLAAMQLSDDVNWAPGDFVALALLLSAVGLAAIVLARRFTQRRLLLGALVIAAGAWLWAELAVGVLTDLGS